MKPNKLIIWDFDGVLADSEHLWVQNWLDTLHRLKQLDLDEAQTEYYIRGKANKTKVELLQKDFPSLTFDEIFWQTLKENTIRLINTELYLTPDVETILQNTDFMHCIATGATESKNLLKIQKLGLDKYFNSTNMFTAYDVERGKPEPDLFLYAAHQMGYAPCDCIVIEDSVVGIQAAIAAHMPVIAYVGATGNNSPEHIAKCKDIGATYIAKDMFEVAEILREILTTVK